MIAQVDNTPDPERGFSMDKWNGYAASRDRLLGHIATRKPRNR